MEQKFIIHIDTEQFRCYYLSTGTITEQLLGGVKVRLDKKKLQICLARKKMNAVFLREYGIGCAAITKAMNEEPISPKTAGKIASALDVDIIELLKEE